MDRHQQSQFWCALKRLVVALYTPAVRVVEHRTLEQAPPASEKHMRKACSRQLIVAAAVVTPLSAPKRLIRRDHLRTRNARSLGSHDVAGYHAKITSTTFASAGLGADTEQIHVAVFGPIRNVKCWPLG